MNKDTRNMIIIVALLLIFTVYRLIGARRIKIPFKYGNRIVIYVIFTIPAIYLVIKNKNLYSVIFALSILLISALYASMHAALLVAPSYFMPTLAVFVTLF